jgi:hypothetical protein
MNFSFRYGFHLEYVTEKFVSEWMSAEELQAHWKNHLEGLGNEGQFAVGKPR